VLAPRPPIDNTMVPISRFVPPIRPHSPVSKDLLLPGPAAAPMVESGSIYFIGTATVILRYAGFAILTDPNFLHSGDHVHLGYGIKSQRLTDPAIALEQLPPIDFVLLSHFHGDHFDQLVQQRLDRKLPIVSTPSAVQALRKLGFLATHALDKWDALNVAKGSSRLRITAMPGRHGPPVIGSLLPPVMGSILEFQLADGASAYRMYISGDTLVFDEIREIPKRYPNIDLALLHLGGTRVFGVLVTMDAEQGVQALRIVNPDLAIPIHYNDYDVFKSPLEDFMRAVREAGLESKVQYLRHGETYAFRVPPQRLL
jgi:L-ascorbate metabolism protein UlaG (beta-lactamase superfamily)